MLTASAAPVTGKLNAVRPVRATDTDSTRYSAYSATPVETSGTAL